MQWLLQIYGRMCSWQWCTSASVHSVVEFAAAAWSVHRAGCRAGGSAAACLSVSGASLLPLPEEVWIFLLEKSKANLLHSSTAKENLVVEERSSGRMWLFFKSGLVLYGEGKCEVVRSASVTQSQKVMRQREGGKKEFLMCVCRCGSSVAMQLLQPQHCEQYRVRKVFFSNNSCCCPSGCCWAFRC